MDIVILLQIDILKDHIAEILKTNLPETKSVKQVRKSVMIIQ